jgi:hypothetical protein
MKGRMAASVSIRMKLRAPKATTYSRIHSEELAVAQLVKKSRTSITEFTSSSLRFLTELRSALKNCYANSTTATIVINWSWLPIHVSYWPSVLSVLQNEIQSITVSSIIL